VNIALAILALGLLVLAHEAGHFFASLAVGLRPRRFYIGFPPPLVRTKRNGIEYGIGVIPLGGFVAIPGMHRPIPHDAERRFSAAVSEAPSLAGCLDRLMRALAGDDLDAARERLDDLEGALRAEKLSPEALSRAEKGLTELGDALGPDAYWKAPTWKRLVAIGAGPAANIALTLVVFTLLFTMVGGEPSRVVAGVTEGSPAAAAGIRPGDRIVAVDGVPVSGSELAPRVQQSHGRPLRITVVRDGLEIALPAVTPERIETGYRIGIVREGTGQPLPQAAKTSFEVTGTLSKEIVKAIGGLLTKEGRENVASPIGITQASSDAIDRGTEQFLWVLGLISLSLALLNLLPLLPLDGGHILFTLVEGARGRVVRREIYERVSIVGIVLVLLLFLVGLTNDIDRLT
jgi:regulator of sigma E protease